MLRPSSNLRWVLGRLLESLELDGASSFAPSSSKPTAIDPPHPGESIFVLNQSSMGGVEEAEIRQVISSQDLATCQRAIHETREAKNELLLVSEVL